MSAPPHPYKVDPSPVPERRDVATFGPPDVRVIPEPTPAPSRSPGPVSMEKGDGCAVGRRETTRGPVSALEGGGDVPLSLGARDLTIRSRVGRRGWRRERSS